MKKNIDTYQFNGDWEFNLKLPLLSKIRSEYWFRHNRNSDFREVLNNGYVPVTIWGERNYDPDPTKSQENAIKYLIQNEKEILESLFTIFIEDINKQHVEWCGEDDWIPELNSEYDLGKLALISSIHIILDSKDEHSYIQFDFEYRGDKEHGLALILHKLSSIGFSGIGDMGYECIYKDLGLDESKVFEEMLEKRKIGENEVHKPLEKYGKFKPWQLNATSDYFQKLLRDKQNEKLIEEIENNQWNINLRFPGLNKNLTDKAAYSNNVEMLDYLIEKGGDFSNSILQCINHGFHHPESIKLLVEKGASIDTRGYWGRTPLCDQIQNYARAIKNVDYYKNRDEKRLEKTKEELIMITEKIKLYISLGGNPEKLDSHNNGYKEILKKEWNASYLKDSQIISKIEELVYPNNTKKKGWRFWKN